MVTSGCLLLFVHKSPWQIYLCWKRIIFFHEENMISYLTHRDFAYFPLTKAIHLEIVLNLVISSKQIAQTLDVREHGLRLWKTTPSEKIFPMCSQLDAARAGRRTDDVELFINTQRVRLNLLMCLCLLVSQFCQQTAPYICCQRWVHKAPKGCALGAKLQNSFQSHDCWMNTQLYCAQFLKSRDSYYLEAIETSLFLVKSYDFLWKV